MLHLTFDCAQALQDSSGSPLYGKALFCVRGTETATAIYTYAENVYTIAENPQYTNLNGFLPQSIFFAPSIITVRLYKYVGTLADPSADADPAAWSFDRNFDTGMELPAGKNDTIIYTIDALRAASTSLSTVSVIGYFDAHDCGQRTYYWDSQATDSEDGGYVIKSNYGSTGRWILLTDDDTMPSQFYGVYPGSETNISALLTYSQSVGTIAEHTAPVVHFVKGTYASAVGYITPRELMIEAGTQFTNASFTCPDVQMIGKNSAWIADFSFTKNAATAYSSWFRTLSKFYSCGAKRFVVDAVYGTNDTWANALTISAAEFVQAGAALPVIPNAGTSILTLSQCTVGNAIFNSGSQYITFANMEFTDKYFTGTWDASHLVVSAAYLNCANFINPVNYFNACVSSGITSINMANSTVALGLSQSAVNVPSGAIISNCTVTDKPQFRSAGDLTLRNIISTSTGESAVIAAGALSMTGCSFAGKCDPYGTTIKVSNSSFTSFDTGYSFGSSAVISNCTFSGAVNSYNASADSGSEPMLTMLNCKMESTLATYDVILNNCTVAGIHTQHTKAAFTASGYFYGVTFASGQTFTGNSGTAGVTFSGGWSGCNYGGSFITVVNPEAPLYTHLFNQDDSVHTYFFSGNNGDDVPSQFEGGTTLYDLVSDPQYTSPVLTFIPSSEKFFSIGKRTVTDGRIAVFIGDVEWGLTSASDFLRVFFSGASMNPSGQIGTGSFSISGCCPATGDVPYQLTATVTYSSSIPSSNPLAGGEMVRTAIRTI